MPINEERLLEDFLALIRIDAPPGKEAPVAQRLEAQLRELGFDVARDDADVKTGGNTGNLIAFRKGATGAPPILLNAHMDTVQSTAGLVPRIEDGWIRSSGDTILGADDRAGIAVMMEAARSLVEEGEVIGDIEIVFTVSEETGLWGAKALDHGALRSRHGYVFDSGPPAGAIVPSAPTHEVFHVRYHGKASHAAVAPELGVNAISAASKAIARMTLGRLDDKTTCSVGVIHGGSATNVIPDFVTVEAEARSRDPETLARVVADMTAAFRAGASDVGADVDIDIERHYNGYEISLEDDLVRRAVAVNKALGVKPTIRPGAGGSDANIFNANGITALVIGVGYLDPHGVNERIRTEDLVYSARVVRELILASR